MITIINGPGIPFLDKRSGLRLQLPRFSAHEMECVAQSERIIFVNPFSTLTIKDAYWDEFREWLRQFTTLPRVSFLLSCGSVTRSDYNGAQVQSIPVLSSAASVSKVMECLKQTGGLFVWWDGVNRNVLGDLAKKYPNAIVCSDADYGVQRMRPGRPLFYTYNNGLGPMPHGTWEVELSTKSVSILDRESVEQLVFNGEPGTFRVFGAGSVNPDAGTVLADTVLQLTADKAFAEAAKADLETLSLDAITIL